jgi:hypothetical protein
VGSSFSLNKSGTIDAITARLAVGFANYTSEAGNRFIELNNPDTGNGGLVGLTGTLSAGPYQGNVKFGISSFGSDSLIVSNPNFIGFAMNSIPEPSTCALLFLGTLGLAVRRSRRRA